MSAMSKTMIIRILCKLIDYFHVYPQGGSSPFKRLKSLEYKKKPIIFVFFFFCKVTLCVYLTASSGSTVCIFIIENFPKVLKRIPRVSVATGEKLDVTNVDTRCF